MPFRMKQESYTKCRTDNWGGGGGLEVGHEVDRAQCTHDGEQLRRKRRGGGEGEEEGVALSVPTTSPRDTFVKQHYRTFKCRSPKPKKLRLVNISVKN